MIGLGMQLCQSTALTQRQEMLAELEQSMQVIQRTELSLELYRKREEISTRLYRQALSKGRVILYNNHGIQYEFALVSKKQVPEWIYKECGYAFSHCLMDTFESLLRGKDYALSQGSWLLFVIHDFFPHTPSKIIKYASLHERAEMATLGDHNLASKFEFGMSAKENNLRWYINWLEKHYPEKFASTFTYQTHWPIPESGRLKNLLDNFSSTEEAEHIQATIEGFEWPHSILTKLTEYKKVNDEITTLIFKSFDEVVLLLKQSVEVKEIVQDIKNELKILLKQIKLKKQYLNSDLIGDIWAGRRGELANRFLERVNFIKTIKDQIQVASDLSKIGSDGSLPNQGVLASNFEKAIKHV